MAQKGTCTYKGEGRKRDEDTVRGYIPQGCDSRTMYGYWAAGGIDSHDEGATDHPETETPAVPALLHLLLVLHPPPPPPPPPPPSSCFLRTTILIALPFGD